ncbi:Ig-like domain-containing protein [Lacrimispora indolis]|uniref:Ig-like domain-containing protein n=1 Tax=Lacrimispora indolis TaxID=69825 RepID=UPI000427472F|nr:Ig-like domain-containing protein [[Clostridium] methoxybenzovorans]
MKNFKKVFCFAVVFLLVWIATNKNSYATETKQMDLSNWSSVILAKDRGVHVSPNWKLSSTKTSVTQTTNSRPTAFISDTDFVNAKIEGSFSVDSLNDDDFIGFVFGYKDTGHYYLFDWKQAHGGDTNFNNSGKQGMSVKLVNTDSIILEDDLWSSLGSGDKIKVLYHNDIAYADKTLYNFSLTYIDEGEFNIVVKQGTKIIDDITIIDNTYTSGKFGFYNFSQDMVTYTGFTIKEIAPILKVSSVEKDKVGLTWTAASEATDYLVKRSTSQGGPYTTIATGITDTSYTDTDVINGTTYYYVVSSVNTGVEINNSNEVSATPVETPVSTDAKLKVVLEVSESLQLSVNSDLGVNTEMTWTSSDDTVATVNGNGIVTALSPGNTIITVKSGNGSYTDYINVLVVEDASDYRLAIDLKVGQSSKLTIDDFTDTVNATWTSLNSSIAEVSGKGKVIALSKGLSLITAKDEEGNVIGRIYVRVRE